MAVKTISSKEKVLLDKISHHKQQLAELQKKQKLELGNLAYKHRLHHVDTKILDAALAQLSKELVNDTTVSN